MKKLTLLLSSVLLISAGLSTSYSSITKSDNLNAVEINLHSDVDIYGVQFDLTYNSNELSLVKDDIVSLVESVSVYSKVIEPGMARVIMFSKILSRLMWSPNQ